MVHTPAVQTATGRFVQEWFDLLSRHEPVELLLDRIADEGLEMVFPERTLRSHADFRDWYATVGDTYRRQDHVLEKLDTRPGDGGTHVELTVRWSATRISDSADLRMLADQEWLIRTEPADHPVIVTYRVRGMRHA